MNEAVKKRIEYTTKVSEVLKVIEYWEIRHPITKYLAQIEIQSQTVRQYKAPTFKNLDYYFHIGQLSDDEWPDECSDHRNPPALFQINHPTSRNHVLTDIL